MDVNVCVIGGGIIGLSTAVNVAQLSLPGYRVHVTLIAERFSPDTTADGSGGFWEPCLCGDTPVHKIRYTIATIFKDVCLCNSIYFFFRKTGGIIM